MSDLASVLDKASSVVRPKTKASDKAAVAAVMSKGNIPPNYREVKLIGSLGKLQAPAVLHFRNFTVEESLLLAQMTDSTEDSTIVQLLNACVWEDFECGLLHRKDAAEVMLNIYAAWWGQIIEGFYYAIDDTQEMGNGLNRSIAEIPISAIHIKSLADDVKDPVTLTDPETGYEASFIQPCLIFSKIVADWLKVKFAADEVKFNDFKWTLRENEKREKAGRQDLMKYDVSLEDEYYDYRQERIAEELRVSRALLVKSVNGHDLTTLEDKIKALSDIPLNMWETYQKISAEKFEFGFDPEVEFKCSVKHVMIKRRFSFRLVDFVPTVDDRRVSPYTVRFG